MLELQKIFLLVRFFNRISCNKSLKIKISRFLHVHSVPWGWNVLGAERPLRFWRHVGWRNTKICIHRASRMKRKRGKCWKPPIFEGKLLVFICYLREMKIACSITLLYSSTFYSLFLPFFVLKIFKFKYDKIFVRDSASISKCEWFEQPLWHTHKIYRRTISSCVDSAGAF